jgi:thioesterase domain-containing protein/acyl carrier protein
MSSHAYPLANASKALRLTIIGGEAMYKEDWATWSESNPGHRLINSYGPTECTVIALAEEISATEMPKDKIAIGKPLPGYSIRIVDQWGSTLPQGLAGILHITGDAVSFGYVGLEPTAKGHASFMNHFDEQGRAVRSHSTGDTVVAAENGAVFYIGRFDRQVKIRGFRIGLDEVSSQIKSIEGVSDAVVQVIQSPHGMPTLAAFVLAENDLNSTEIREKLSSEVPDYMVPETILMLAEIPLTSNGKVDARKLEGLVEQAKVNRVQAFQLPEGPVEDYLHGLWCKLFKRDHISVEDNFFEIGGHSLLAVQLVANLKKEFDIEFPLASLISYPTIRKLAELVNSKKVEHLWNVMVPIRTKGSLAPIFLIHGAGLNVLMFQSLARFLHPERPIYALQARRMDSEHCHNCTIPKIAADYLQEIKQIQPSGPYHLLGYSIGGFIVFEMTKQLEKNQDAVAFAGLIDSVAAFTKESKKRYQRAIDAVLTPFAKLAFNVQAFFKEEQSERRRFLMQKKNNLKVTLYTTLSKFKLIKLPVNGLERSQERGAYTVNASTIAMTKALEQYELEPIATRIDLFKASKASFYIRERANYGWEPYLQNGLNVHLVPGDHNHIFTPPNDQVFAELLGNRLNEIARVELQESKHGKHQTPVAIIDFRRNRALQSAFADLWPPLRNAN